jgi:hypothetical protein
MMLSSVVLFMIGSVFSLQMCTTAELFLSQASLVINCATDDSPEKKVPAPAELIEVARIWDKAPHSAFTDLIRFKGKFYCTFREGTGHVPGKTGRDGETRVIVSSDGRQWESLALLKKKGFDLRDPKISVTPDQRLMLIMGGSIYKKGVIQGRMPQVSFSDIDGNNFSPPQPIKMDPNITTDGDWLWRVTWHQQTGYGVVYQTAGSANETELYLVKTLDGIVYKCVTRFEVQGSPNEATVRVMSDGEMLILLRREAGDKHGYLGRSKPPYTKWIWHDTQWRLGGPDFITLPDGRLIVGTRVYTSGGAHTEIFTSDRKGRLQKLIRLPSGGDTSYPGLLWHDGLLWVSYYSSHEEKTSIYLAKVKLP